MKPERCLRQSGRGKVRHKTDDDDDDVLIKNDFR